MITLQEIYTYLNALLLSRPFSDCCVNGIQVEGQKEVHKIATAVSASIATIEAAADAGVQLLIVHHGMFWNHDSIVVKGAKKEKLKLLILNDISLMAYHLPLDAHQEIGNNWSAAKEMGWTDLQPFGFYKGIPIGVKGKIPTQNRKDFKRMLENYYQHPAICALGGKENINTVALISGGAYKNIEEAAEAGVDCFITGNFDEPAWHQAHELGINFYALGHSATERIGPKALCTHLQEKYIGMVDCQFIDIANPF